MIRLVNVGEISRELRRIRQRRRVLWCVFFAAMPVMLLADFLFDSHVLNLGVVFLWFATLTLSWLLTVTSRCPQCRQLYHISGLLGGVNLFAQRCRHCGLELDRGSAD